MIDDEVLETLESMTRSRAWLIRATEMYPDLRIYRWGGRARFCSLSVNAIADEFELDDLVQRHLMPGEPPREANVAVWCFTDFEGDRIHSWPPLFVLGGIDDPDTAIEERHLHEHWRVQLREAGIANALIHRIDEATDGYGIQEADNQSWRDGDEHFSVWSAQDSNGEVVGVVRVHERLHFQALCAMRTRAEALGIKIWSHDGGYTVRTAADLQAFIDETVRYFRDREDDRDLEGGESRDAA